MAEGKKSGEAVAAEFALPEALLAAALAARIRGLGRLRAYTPLPVEGLENALDLRGTTLGWVALCGYLFGGIFCFGLITYATLVAYRFNIGGRPPFSWPYYVIPSNAIGLLFSALFLLAAFLLACKLPRLNHPAFDIEGIERASADRFFLCVYPENEDFDSEAVKRFFRDLPARPLRVQEVRQ